MTVSADIDQSQFREAAPTEARYRGSVGRYFRDVEEDHVLSLLGEPGEVTLDLGCGTGRMFGALRRPGKTVIGADISHDMLSSARRNPVPVAGLVASDFYALPIADRSLDTVVAVGTFHLTHDLERVMAEIGRTMRPGGIFLFTCWNERPWAPRRLFQGVHAAPHRFEDLAVKLRDAGFEIDRAMSTFYFPSSLFWAGCKLLRAEALRSRWIGAVIAFNRLFLARPAWRLRGAQFIVRARKI
jgi:SAM-dependent methyltransferase